MKTGLLSEHLFLKLLSNDGFNVVVREEYDRKGIDAVVNGVSIQVKESIGALCLSAYKLSKYVGQVDYMVILDDITAGDWGHMSHLFADADYDWLMDHVVTAERFRKLAAM